MNMTELLDNAVSRWPDNPALIEGSSTISYSDLAAKTRGLARELARFNLPRACRIGLCYPNSILYVALTYALWRIDAVVVPIPTEWTDEEVTGVAEAMRLQAI